MDFRQELQQIKNKFEQTVKQAQNAEHLEQLRVKFLGRKAGLLTMVMNQLGGLSLEIKKEIGLLANQVKIEIERTLNQKEQEFAQSRLGQTLQSESLDITQPGILRQLVGHLHPHTQMIRELSEIFTSMGFDIYEGPEISNEEYEFDSLNFPLDHPARESMDTFWLKTGVKDPKGKDRYCLRPHLTGGSIRYMQTHKPPFRFIYPGRVFRNEATDASHEHTFYQFEALIVEKNFSFAEGKSFIKAIIDKIFKKDVKIRIRTGFFPFVEPGFETDIQCQICNGIGCSVCKHSGWLELMPGGPPHPNVLKAGGIDPKKWTGFYVNLGLDRLVIMKHGIDDIRYFHGGDLRFLKQF